MPPVCHQDYLLLAQVPDFIRFTQFEWEIRICVENPLGKWKPSWAKIILVSVCQPPLDCPGVQGRSTAKAMRETGASHPLVQSRPRTPPPQSGSMLGGSLIIVSVSGQLGRVSHAILWCVGCRAMCFTYCRNVGRVFLHSNLFRCWFKGKSAESQHATRRHTDSDSCREPVGIQARL